jgi:pimeloyl-ACP methyl ester carboxylesterase
MQMARHIPAATFQFVPRAGHNAMADHPAMVNRYLLDFFQQDTQGAPERATQVSEIA